MTRAPAEEAATAAVAETVAARIEAGCALWDMSVTEAHATVMCSAGLVAVAYAVLRHCAGAVEMSRTSVAEAARTVVEAEVDAGAAETGARGTGVGETLRDDLADLAGDCGGMGVLEAERLREITCGLLANACSHRNLR